MKNTKPNNECINKLIANYVGAHICTRPKTNTAITLIALIITIIVMLILAGVTISITINGGLFGQASEAVRLTDIASTKEQIQEAIIAKQLEKIKTDGITIPEIKSILNDIVKPGYTESEITITNEKINFPSDLKTKNNNPFTMEQMLNIITGNGGGGSAHFPPLPTENDTWIATTANDPEWYNYKDIGTNTTASANPPALLDGMTPIKYNGGNDTVGGVTGTNISRWANAMTADGSFWVWIPRYEYKIDYVTNGVVQGVNTDQKKAGIIDVRFISTTTKAGSSGYTTDSKGVSTSGDGYIIHPAFTNNVNGGGWDSEIAGIWVAKFEMSGETNGAESQPGNVAISTTVKAVSKPNVRCWGSINIANCYTNSLNYGSSLGHAEYNSHLIKNREWRSSSIFNT